MLRKGLQLAKCSIVLNVVPGTKAAKTKKLGYVRAITFECLVVTASLLAHLKQGFLSVNRVKAKVYFVIKDYSVQHQTHFP